MQERVQAQASPKRRSTRPHTLSKEAIESIANTPPKRTRTIRSNDVMVEESEGEIIRLACADAVVNKYNMDAINTHSANMRMLLGKRIDLIEFVLSARTKDKDVPKTRKKMLKHVDKERYILGERKELESFMRLEVLKLVDRPKNKNVMKSG